MKDAIALLTSRVELEQTFLFLDLRLLALNYSTTLFAFFPPRNKKKIIQNLGNDIRVVWACSFKFFMYILYANVIILYKYPKRFVSALNRIIKLYWVKPKSLLINLILFPSTVACALKMKESNVCHIHGYWATYAATSAMLSSILTNIPYSFSIHAHDILETPSALYLKYNKALWVLACSEWALKRFRERVESLGKFNNRFKLCYHGLDIQKYYTPYVTRRAMDDISIISIGRIVPKKGFEILIRAINIIAGQQPVRCSIYGPIRDFFYFRKLKTEIYNSSENARILLSGYATSDELKVVLQTFSLYVQPSVIDKKSGDSDGIPNTLLEAMAVGIPVIGSKTGGIPEVIINGSTGLLVEPGNPEALAEAILKVFDKKDEALSRAHRARQLIRRNFNLLKRQRCFIELIK